MFIKNKIWEEMKQAHANVLCVKWYTDKQRKHDRYYQMFIALVASGGTFGYLLNSFRFCCKGFISIFHTTRERVMYP